MSSAIDFNLSGAGESAAGPLTLKDVQQTCVDLGFVKKEVADTKPLAQRANVAEFFKALGVTSLSGFKARFYAEKLPQPYVGQTPLVAEKDKPKEEVITWKVPSVTEYDELAAEWTDKKWRMLPKPGGAVMKPEDWCERRETQRHPPHPALSSVQTKRTHRRNLCCARSKPREVKQPCAALLPNRTTSTLQPSGVLSSIHLFPGPLNSPFVSSSHVHTSIARTTTPLMCTPIVDQVPFVGRSAAGREG